MADIVVLGAGVCGLASAALLAEDGHDVVVLPGDRDRQAEIDAVIDGRPTPLPADDAAAVGRALTVAMAYDPEAYRAFLDIVGVIKHPREVFSRPGLVDRIMAIAQTEPPLQVPGPTRQELMALVA